MAGEHLTTESTSLPALCLNHLLIQSSIEPTNKSTLEAGITTFTWDRKVPIQILLVRFVAQLFTSF